MNISKKALRAFNLGKEPKFNINVNKLLGITFAEHYIYRKAMDYYFGIFRKPLTAKMISEYIRNFGLTFEDDYKSYVELLCKKGLA